MTSAKTSTKERYWIAVASKDHVENGVTQGIAQANHGKRSPMKRLSRGDKIIYYSFKKTFGKPEPYQMFTAIGEVLGDEAHVGVMSGDFQPIRRNIRYFEVHDTPIVPLIDSLTFIKDKTNGIYVPLRIIRKYPNKITRPYIRTCAHEQCNAPLSSLPSHDVNHSAKASINLLLPS